MTHVAQLGAPEGAAHFAAAAVQEVRSCSGHRVQDRSWICHVTGRNTRYTSVAAPNPGVHTVEREYVIGCVPGRASRVSSGRDLAVRSLSIFWEVLVILVDRREGGPWLVLADTADGR